MKKKFAWVLVWVLPILLLSGCAKSEEELEQEIWDKSEISSTDDYLRFLEYKNAGLLDEDGYYSEPVPEEPAEEENAEPAGQVHVTFAICRYIELAYYSDAAMTVPIDTNRCYLNPGDALYAKVVDISNSNSNLYGLSEFRIMVYDSDGECIDSDSVKYTSEAPIYEIPSDYTGTELSVIPVGEYESRILSLRVFYTDDTGKEKSLTGAGTWSVNGAAVTGKTKQVKSYDPYTVEFSYDPDDYFFVDTSPKSFKSDVPGSVIFYEVSPAEDSDTNYSVELHPYLKLTLRFSDEAEVTYGQTTKTIRKNKTWETSLLKYGDVITIDTAGTCSIVSGDYRHISAAKDPISGGTRYTLTVVPEADNSAAEILTDTVDVTHVYTVTLGTDCDYGSCVYKLDGKKVSGEITVQDGQTLTLTYKIDKGAGSFSDKSEGIGGFVHDLVKSRERTVTIPITADLDGAVLDPDDWFEITPEGE